MSNPAAPIPARLVISVFLNEKLLIETVAEELARSFGPMDLVSAWLDFDYTDYYAAEFGAPLFRRVFSFPRPVDQGRLADIKHTTNAIEARFTENGRRRVNIDPGYLTMERFVLATGKNFTHRVYLEQGIYADLTLLYQHNDFTPLPWTYPDYAGTEMRTFLSMVRERYVRALEKTGALRY